MMAIRRVRPLFVLAAAALALLTSGCSEKRVVPRPTPTPTPRPAPPPSPPPPAPAPVARDWREAPITPGDWSWSMENGQSVARFAGGTLVLRCDRTAGTIVLQRIGEAPGPEPLTVTTTSGVRTLSANPQAGSLVARLAAHDPVIDAMIFSRGRFAVEAPGFAPLYVPSWPEVGRVAEDCRF